MGTPASREAIKGEQQHVKESLPAFNPSKLADICVDFAGQISEIGYYSYQKTLMRAIFYDLLTDGGNSITALFARQSGKTEAVSGVISVGISLFPALASIYPEMDKFSRGFFVGTFAPLNDLVSTMLTRVSLRVSTDMFEAVTMDMNLSIEKRNPLLLSNGSIFKGHTLNTKLESFTYHLIIIDEAQDGNDDKIKLGIIPMMTATNGTIVLIGTCSERKSFFYERIKYNKKSSPEHYFEVQWETAAAENKYYKKFIERQLANGTLREDSPDFRMNYKLEWLFEDGQLVTEEDLTMMFSPKLRLSSSLAEAKEQGIITDQTILVAGVDVAKKLDSTVVTVLAYDKLTSKKTILNWFELRGDSYDSQASQIFDFLTLYYPGLEYLVIDATGVGEYMKDTMVSKFSDTNVMVEGFVFSRPSKSEGYRHLISVMRNKELAIPASFGVRKTRVFRNFKAQMLDVQKDMQGAFIVVAHPEVSGAHDDYPDSLMLACYAAKRMGDVLNISPEPEGYKDMVGRRRGVRGRAGVNAGRYYGEHDVAGRPIKR